MKRILSIATAVALLASGLPVFAAETLEDQKHESGVLLDGSGKAQSAGLMNYVNSSTSEETLNTISAAKDVETAVSPAVARAKAGLAVSPDGLKPPEVKNGSGHEGGAGFFESGIFKFYKDTLSPPEGGSRLAKLGRALLTPITVPLMSVATGVVMTYCTCRLMGNAFGVASAVLVGAPLGAVAGVLMVPATIVRNIYHAIK